MDPLDAFTEKLTQIIASTDKEQKDALIDEWYDLFPSVIKELGKPLPPIVTLKPSTKFPDV